MDSYATEKPSSSMSPTQLRVAKLLSTCAQASKHKFPSSKYILGSKPLCVLFILATRLIFCLSPVPIFTHTDAAEIRETSFLNQYQTNIPGAKRTGIIALICIKCHYEPQLWDGAEW